MDLEERFELDLQFKASFNWTGGFFISKFSHRHKETAAFGFVVSLIWGTLMKYLIYKHLLKAKLLTRPINLMVLVDEAIHHATNGFLLIQLTIWMISGGEPTTVIRALSLSNYVNHHFYCNLISAIGVFTFQYATFGSVGIAIFRVLYFKKFKLTARLNSNKNMVVWLPLFTVAITIVNSSLFLRGPGTGRVAFSSCMGRSEKFQARTKHQNRQLF
jgi:hypothetical protein